MGPRTCDYVAKKSDPESWHGTEASTFYIDLDRRKGGLGITEWHCPHPPRDRDNASDDGSDNQYCVFHTDPADVPNEVDEREALLDALQDASTGPRADRPEHRGQFVGATFGTIDLSGETIAATDHHDVRFDHARFQTNDRGLDFQNAAFATEGQHPISFNRTKFITTGEGDVGFWDATFRTDGEGHVWFRDATFRTDGEGDVGFGRATFRTDGEGDVEFGEATFRTDGEGHVWFWDATFRTDGEGHVEFKRATFRTDGEGDVGFIDATLVNADLQYVEFAEARFGGVDLTGTDLREAEITDISVNGATTCKRLNEGYGYDPSTGRLSITARLKRLYGGSEFDYPQQWDAAARAYHQLKTVFSEHGLVGRARTMHVRERRARSLEAKAANGWFDRRNLQSLLSRVFTGYGVQVRNLVIWMVLLFLFSTVVYVDADVKNTLANNIAYSVLAFTVAPPKIPSGVGTQIVMMFETFLGTLSIVLLGYILGNRERF